MGLFERWLSVWVALAIAAGVALGSLFPTLFAGVAALEFAHVNLLVAVLIWVMIYPMMVQIDFAAVRDVGKRPRGLVLTLTINWLVKPFTMALLGWLFFRVLFADWVDPQSAGEYIAGMILLGVAPCTAMVFVWSQLTRGDPNYTLVQVSVNDLIMVFAFAPLVSLLLGVSDIQVPWATLLLSVLLYVVLPLAAGIATRRLLQRRAPGQLKNLLRRLKPWSILGLLGTVALLFGLQADTLLSQPLTIVLIAIPLLVQTYGIFALAYLAAWKLRLPHPIAALFGLHSGAALATVVGVLVEVPVMLSLVAFANRTRHWFPGTE